VPAETPALDKLLTDLGSDRFATREEATRALERLGPEAEAELRKALEAKPSAEVRLRIERHLDRLQTDESRHVRAVAVLEKVGTPEARQQLRRLADGAPPARLTREAKAALERLGRRAGGR
jgi:HEAT repeat protein